MSTGSDFLHMALHFDHKLFCSCSRVPHAPVFPADTAMAFYFKNMLLVT